MIAVSGGDLLKPSETRYYDITIEQKSKAGFGVIDQRNYWLACTWFIRKHIIIGSYDNNKKDDFLWPFSDCGYVLRNQKKKEME